MAEPASNKKTKGDIVYRTVSLLLIGGVLYAQLFIKANYVSADKYEADRKAAEDRYNADKSAQAELISKMHDEILTLINSDKINTQQNESLKDHETRIRVLEHLIPVH